MLSTRTFANTLQGFKQLQDWLKFKKHPDAAVRFTMEATGVYYEGLAFFLYEKGYMLHVVLPNYERKKRYWYDCNRRSGEKIIGLDVLIMEKRRNV